jgi:hypothetical protein
MNNIWAFLYRMTSWVCAGLAWVNAAIVFWDGINGQLQAQYRVITLMVALLFGLIGAFVLGLERTLGKILRLYPTHSGAQPDGELANAWRSLHMLLTVAVVFILAVMVAGLLAITSRLGEGFKLFG